MQANNRKLFITALNSTAVFMLTFLGMFVTYMFTRAIVGTFFELDSVVNYFGMDTNPSDGRWFRGPVVYTFAAPPFLCLFLSLVAKYFHFTYYSKKRGIIKLALIWIHIHGIIWFFGGWILGILLGKGFGHAILWAYIPVPLQYGIGVLSMLFLILVGFNSTKSFLQTANSQDLIENEFNDRVHYILAIVVAPWVITSSIVYLLMTPNITLHDTLIFMMYVPVIIPIVSFCKGIHKITLPKDHEVLKPASGVLISTLVAIIIFRVILIDVKVLCSRSATESQTTTKTDVQKEDFN